jgi:hypothetical protein
MHDTTAIRTDIAGDTGISPEPPIREREVVKASGLYVVRSLDDERLPPFRRRGASRSWLPGTWGDPF